MKKLVILGTALLSLSLVASEIQIKGGYDFNRNQVSTFNTVLDFGNGATAGAEYIFDNQGEFEWGIGAEYKFDQKFKGNDTKWMRQIPVYALGKFNLVTTKKGNDVLYVLGRAGIALNESKGYAKDKGAKYDNGLYVAGGLGTEMGPVSLEAIYERAATPFTNARGFRTNDYQESFGLRLGLRLGNLVNDRTAKVTTVEKIVYVDKIVKVPGETVVTPPLNTKTVVLPFSCVATEKKCVIRGFKVDGRTPNAAEAKDLGTISSVINSFAKGGTVDFVGHTDSTGSDAYNQKLSVARAQNVARLLQEYGLSNDVKVGSISGKGETQPADTNATVQGRYNNRRVELFFNNVDFSKANVKFIN
mgnify:CR=1 FL=1